MSKKKWYARTHQFTPYTKADGQAVSDEFDAIQVSFERIPEMRDDGKGFAVSPLIPEPTEPNHPVPFKMLTETEASVNNARDDVIAKAQQVAQHTQTVETNTQTAINQANSATQSATSAAASSQSADESEGWARKWASNPIDEIVAGDKYSAFHYASKAATSAQNLSSAERSAKTNADIAVQKAEEAAAHAARAKSIADGEVEYEKVLNVPRASGTQAGIVQLTDDTGIDSDKLGLSARAGKKLAQMIAVVQLALNNYIPLNKRSSSVNSNDENNVATSKAVKTAYDKGVEAKNAADNAQRTANSANDNANARVAKSGDTMTGNLTVPNLIVNDPTNNNNFVQIGDDTKLIDVDMGHTVGLQTTDNANDAYIAYGATKKRFGFDANMFFADSALSTNHIGHGSYAQQYNVAAPFYVHQTLSVARDTYHPFIKGRVRAAGQYGAAFSFGYTTNQRQGGDGFGAGVIHLIEDNGAERGWFFNHDGSFTSPGDVVTGDGKRLTKSHQTNYAYVETTAAIWGGLKINRNGEHMLIESNDRGGFNFIRRNNNGANFYVLNTPTKNGTLATLEDLPKERLIWQGSTDNAITINTQVSRGVLFVLMDTPHGANANRPIWFSSPIEQCHDTRIGEYDTGGTAGDYNYVTLALLHRNGNNITITPQSDGRKPRIQKVVVFG